MSSDAPAKCFYCGKPLTPGQSIIYKRVWGWARVRSQGGTNHIDLPNDLGERACDSCIRDLKRGIDPTTQRNLLTGS